VKELRVTALYKTDVPSTPVTQPRWQPWEDEILRKHWGKIPEAKVAAMLSFNSRSVCGCENRASKLGIKSERRARKLAGNDNYKGDKFYVDILLEFQYYTTGEMARRRRVGLGTMRAHLARARKYRNEGKLDNEFAKRAAEAGSKASADRPGFDYSDCA
jgi:hypothetical protein